MLEQIFTDRKTLIWRSHIEFNSPYSMSDCITRIKSTNGQKIGSLKLSIKITDLESADNNVHFIAENWYGNAKAYAIGTISAAQHGTYIQFNVGIAQIDLLIYGAVVLFVCLASYKSQYFSIVYLIGLAIVLSLISMVIGYAYASVKSELEISVTKLLSA
ncbi:MAG: hypothetical protein GC179_15575 [Anaerolineaceae bacterium]|nr:hypothetical protein [Anaerolineaceae bacterium]